MFAAKIHIGIFSSAELEDGFCLPGFERVICHIYSKLEIDFIME